MSGTNFELANVKVSVEGLDKAIDFNDLAIHQRLADVNSFSFIWRVRNSDTALNTQVQFYRDNLGKQVTITVADGITFKGYVQYINCCNRYADNIEYEISGKGIYMKLAEIPQCKTYYKKTLQDIFTDQCSDLAADLAPTYTQSLYYTVQYNQTTFDFLCMLAARWGQWFYYTGEEMKLGKYDEQLYTIALQSGDIIDINISAMLRKATDKTVSYDIYKGEGLRYEQTENTPDGTGWISATVSAGQQIFGNEYTHAHLPHAATDETLKVWSANNQHTRAASSVYISARTHLTGIKLGGLIELKDGDTNMGKYVVTELHHVSKDTSNYQNHFMAIPAEAPAPPYTNPNIFPVCKAQAAVVKDNEDDKKLGRIKVHFPWQQPDETTPWLPVMVPHAGKDKGFLFLPEKDDRVMIDFIGNNAERPYVIGSFYTQEDGHGNDHTGNNTKVIGTRSGRRMEIDDDQGAIFIIDNFKGERPINGLTMRRTEDMLFLGLASKRTDDTFAAVVLNTTMTDDDIKDGIQLLGQDGGNKAVEIIMDTKGKKIVVRSKGVIEISADKQIDINSGTININASQKINLKGGSGVHVEGEAITLSAKTEMQLNAKTKVQIASDAEMELGAAISAKIDGGATTAIKGGMVMIN